MTPARNGLVPTDSDMLNWLESSRGLELFHNPTTWTRKDGTTFASKFTLSANGTRFAPAATLREAIAQAMSR